MERGGALWGAGSGSGQRAEMSGRVGAFGGNRAFSCIFVQCVGAGRARDVGGGTGESDRHCAPFLDAAA
jgi:hypothetical protein